MSATTRLFYYLTIATFLGFFVIEAILWTLPTIHHLLLPQLNPGLAVLESDQAEVLRALFVNQGVYNLMVAIGGVAGLRFLARGEAATGRAFVVFTCLFAIGAAVTLLVTTHAYLLGVAQLIFPSLALMTLGKASAKR